MSDEANARSGAATGAEGELAGATNGEPTGAEGLFDGMTPEKLHDSYKSLQTEYGKNNESLNDLMGKFEKFGGVDQLLQWADYLDTNEDFAKWVEGQNNQNEVNLDNYDDETKKAIELVQKMSQAEVQKALQNEVAPLREHLIEQQLQANVEILEDKYGDSFNELRDTMSKLSRDLPDSIQDSASIEVLEDLYWKAMRTSGKFDDYAAKVYQAKLEKVKAQSTEKPTQKASPGRIEGKLSMQQSYEAAKSG